MAAVDPPRRRFVTRHDVEDAHRGGQGIVLGPRDVLTDEAATRARDLGVSITRTAAAAPTRRYGVAQPSPSAPQDRLRAIVKAAVVAELGREDSQVETVIDAVLARRGIG
jgi:hypothetical protein